MVITFFLVDNKNKKSRFFNEVFLLAYISIDVIFRMFFLILNNIKIDFNK